MDIKVWRELFADPGKEYRSAPFWAFNSRMEEENMRFQIREMKQAGMGGFFIHSREGLETPYLSDEWMEAVRQSIDEAEKQDMEVWIYDEDKWPSGCAGGLVSSSDPMRFTSKGLTLEVISAAEAKTRQESGALAEKIEREDGKILGIYTAVTKGDKICSLTRGFEGKTEDETEDETGGDARGCVLILRREISGTSEWYNGYAPSDNLNPDAVREFLKLTHEKYKEEFGGEFGKGIKGFFTDEPNCCDFFSIFTKGRPWLTWTDDMVEYFKQKRGYDPMETLPYLFFEGESASKIRHDFWWSVAERFQESYMKQLYDWCEENGTEVTGHMLYENDLGYQARVCGSAMAQYKYLHRPGIDLLGEQTKEYLTVKQCTSVAHQYGREHTITETYGCTGWEFDFEGQKWLGDWQFVLGIDRRCQHLAQYSITGCRKRDYPPVFSYQTTWWKYNELLENYFARLSACMGQGALVREVLVLHPMTSIWTKCGSRETENLDNMEMNMGWLDEHITSLNEMGEEYNRLAKMLLGAHIDFDFGDEILLAQDGSAKDGRLRIAQCSYRTVVVPAVTSILASTKELLKTFAESGGRVIFAQPLPEMIEGEKVLGLAEELAALPNAVLVPSYESLLTCLKSYLECPLSIRSREGQEDSDVLAMVRQTENGYLLFAVNNDRTREHVVTLELPFVGKVTAYDPWNDTYEEICVEQTGTGKAGSHLENASRSKMRFLGSFTPAQSRIYLIDTAEEPLCGHVKFPYEHPHYADPVFASLGPAASVRRTMENVLPLDVCSYALNGEGFSAPMQVWEAQREIRDRLSMQQVYYNGAPQRYFWLNEKPEQDGTPFALQFKFTVADAVEQDCCVVIEKPEEFEVLLNGIPCERADGYFMDRDMKRFRLPKLQPGEQELVIRGPYRLSSELEDIFIIGEFAVDNERRIAKESGKLHFGDWCFQGYRHYPGSIIYEFELPKREKENGSYLLRMGDYRAVLAEVRLNGQTAGYLIGNTIRELDLTPWMSSSENHLEIEVVGSPRNMFGPFHQTYTGCSRISWADFRTEGRFFTPDYVLEPYGIFGQIVICEK